MPANYKHPSPPQLERARRLLVHEGATGDPDACAIAAGRVYDKLHRHLGPLVGAAGLQALLVRSARLTHLELSFLDVASLDSQKLTEWLGAQDAATATDSATSLFGTFFTLITTLIGERLTTQVLRGAWPTIEQIEFPEMTK